MSVPKELHYFSWEDRWNRGPAWYASHFASARAEPAVGEASTTYTMHPLHPNVPARIAEMLPDTRFLYVVRHPIRRMVSNYMHDWLMGQDDPRCYGDLTKSLDEAWRSHPQLLPCSRYHDQIEQYLQFFPRERFLVLVFEEFAADPTAVHRQIYEFLEVDPSFVAADLTPKNVTAQRVKEAMWMRAARWIPLAAPLGKALVPEKLRRRIQQIGGTRRPVPEVSEALRHEMADELRPDIEALSDFTGRDFGKIWDLTVP